MFTNITALSAGTTFSGSTSHWELVWLCWAESALLNVQREPFHSRRPSLTSSSLSKSEVQLQSKRPSATAKVKNSSRQQERSILAFCLGQSNIVMIIIDGRANQIQHSLTPCTLTAFRLSLQPHLGSHADTSMMQQGQTLSAVLLMIPEREETSGHDGSKGKKGEGKRGWPPKGDFTWEDPKFETQIHSAMNSSKISFIIQPVPYSKAALPLSHFGAVTVMGLSDIFQ